MSQDRAVFFACVSRLLDAACGLQTAQNLRELILRVMLPLGDHKFAPSLLAGGQLARLLQASIDNLYHPGIRAAGMRLLGIFVLLFNDQMDLHARVSSFVQISTAKFRFFGQTNPCPVKVPIFWGNKRSLSTMQPRLLLKREKTGNAVNSWFSSFGFLAVIS